MLHVLIRKGETAKKTHYNIVTLNKEILRREKQRGRIVLFVKDKIKIRISTQLCVLFTGM